MSQMNTMANLPEEVDRGAAGATSLLIQQAKEIRSQKVNWPAYVQSQMIEQDDFEVMTAMESTRRDSYLLQQRPKVAKTIVSLLTHISKDQTIQYLLVLVDDFISEDPSRLDMFRELAMSRRGENQWAVFLNLLTRPDPFITHMTARILSKMACWGPERMKDSDLKFYLTWLKDQLRTPDVKRQLEQRARVPASSKSSFRPNPEGNEYVQSVCRCLQMLLRIEVYRDTFHALDGVHTIVQVLGSGKHNFQIQYQLTFCLWVITFNAAIAEKLNKSSVIPTLADILTESAKEKVTRIILAVFRNLIEKPQDSVISRDNCIQMVQCKVLKQIEHLAQHKFDDEDLIADIEFLNDRLQTSIQDLSSFEEYCSEVKSGRMEWSPVHKSEKFWRENCHRLNDKNYELLRILINIMETGTDPLVLAVACHDIGQYARYYARGKKVLEQLGGKQCVMTHLSHSDPNVRYEALLAVQKLMVHNWEYLGKQIEQKDKSQPQAVNSRA